MHCQNPLDFYPLQCFFVESSVMYRNPLDSNYMYEYNYENTQQLISKHPVNFWSISDTQSLLSRQRHKISTLCAPSCHRNRIEPKVSPTPTPHPLALFPDMLGNVVLCHPVLGLEFHHCHCHMLFFLKSLT